MKTVLFSILIPFMCLLQAGCISAMLSIGGATSGQKIRPHERVIAAAADVVTAPIQVPILLVAMAFAALLTGCATEATVKVEPQRLMQQRYEEASQQEFIGFADDRAFAVVTLIPFAPWSIPRTVVWWCPIHELSPGQFDTLKSRIRIPKAPNPNPAS